MKAPPPPPRSARQPQRKMFLAFRICARPIFAENGKDIFLWVLPSKYSGSVAGRNAKMRGQKWRGLRGGNFCPLISDLAWAILTSWNTRNRFLQIS